MNCKGSFGRVYMNNTKYSILIMLALVMLALIIKRYFYALFPLALLMPRNP